MDRIARGVFHPAGGAGTVFIPMYCSPVGPIQDGSESAATEKFIIIIIPPLANSGIQSLYLVLSIEETGQSQGKTFTAYPRYLP